MEIFYVEVTLAGIGDGCGCLFGASPGLGNGRRPGSARCDDSIGFPTTGGIPDQGAEGSRFCGYPIYDGLVDWDFTHPDQIAGITPGLATEWHVNPDDRREWIFTLRQGVKFHDGTDFNADAVIFNLDRTFDPSRRL